MDVWAIGVGVIAVIFFFFFMVHSSNIPHSTSFSKVLFVIAHPDDEAMFFSPTILHLHQLQLQHHQVNELFLVCLSNGNNDGLGTIREKELIRSCEALHIPKKNVIQINRKELLDGFNNAWDSLLISNIVGDIVDEHHIDTVCFFIFIYFCKNLIDINVQC